MRIIGLNPKKTKWRVEQWHYQAYNHNPARMVWQILKPHETIQNRGNAWDRLAPTMEQHFPQNIVFEATLRYSSIYGYRSAVRCRYNALDENGVKLYEFDFGSNGADKLLSAVDKGIIRVSPEGMYGPALFTFYNRAGNCLIEPYDMELGQPIPIQQ